MSIQRIDHFLLRTSRLEQTRDFFVRVLGLRLGPRPPFSFVGYWLYNGDHPIVHLAASDSALETPSPPTNGSGRPGTGPLDHISLRCTGFAEMKQRLLQFAIEYSERTVPATGDHQLFVEDPNGLTLELSFAAAEGTE